VTTPEHTILIVEDEPKIAALLNDYLQKEGFATMG
jgi:DNA-binding response OmpR family regulator